VKTGLPWMFGRAFELRLAALLPSALVVDFISS
jgi:hypothetical protein